MAKQNEGAPQGALFFGDLLTLPADHGGTIEIASLRALNLSIPDDVLEQVFSDHGTDPAFQEQYEHLELSRIRWEEHILPASVLVEASTYESFNATECSANRLVNFASQGWGCIDVRDEVVEHWTLHRTWIRSPVLIDGKLVRRTSRFHLIEGHSRLGILIGLVRHRVLDASSGHRAWVGTTGANK